MCTAWNSVYVNLLYEILLICFVPADSSNSNQVADTCKVTQVRFHCKQIDIWWYRTYDGIVGSLQRIISTGRYSVACYNI